MIPDAGEVADRAEALLQASTPGPWRAIEGGEESDRTTDHNLYIQAAIDDEMIRWSHIADVPCGLTRPSRTTPPLSPPLQNY